MPKFAKTNTTSTNTAAANIKSTEIRNIRRLAKMLGRIADAAANKSSHSDEAVLVASMYPGAPNVTFGDVRLALEEAQGIDNLEKMAAKLRRK